VPDLAEWVGRTYEESFRTACFIVGNRADAEEAVQEAFLRAWRFRASIGTDTDRRAWLYRVVVNTCCSKLRQEIPRRQRWASTDGLDDMAGASPSPEEALWRAESTRLVMQALRELPVHLRIPIVLRYYAGLSEREIATAIGRRPGTVKSRLHEARRLLAANPSLQGLEAQGGVHSRVPGGVHRRVQGEGVLR